MRFVKLTEIDAIKPFNCGDEDLNGFLPLLKEVPENALTVPLYYDLTQE